jgi:hypothetical protein
MKAYDIPKSGKRGSVVAFKSRFGQCEREHIPSRKPRTAAQRRSQSDFGAASAGWDYLTEDQRTAWRAYGREVRSHPQGGQSGRLTGQMLYTAINRNQAALGLPPLDYPPERPRFGPNPVVGFRITVQRDRLALKLTVSKASAAHILVFASAPFNQGREYCDKFLCLGPVPAQVRGEIDIAALYLSKQDMPWPGSKIFLRIVQQVNGWRSLPEPFAAILSRIPPPPSQPRPRRTASAAC